ncbi:hypothetical protein ACFFUT_08040 [Pseudohalocynthiibacter aestuariivivens]|uniref:DUF3572 domain-containing protein n=1 Tax=Pseudohalocynthiibacter aestuariivivens TaxID=1591409 RepID=A0ABV5JE53_9RHOB|nr:hypothetical protein [Pseudohalocynthiibacter aestuariivivens]MBS9718785.1 hypothetical protein [Pseudohalocynthiibacter aestuariivivens]
MHNLEQKDCLAHAALLEFGFGASADSLCRKYGIEARELETLILQTSGMPILDDSTLSDLEAALRDLAAKTPPAHRHPSFKSVSVLTKDRSGTAALSTTGQKKDEK